MAVSYPRVEKHGAASTGKKSIVLLNGTDSKTCFSHLKEGTSRNDISISGKCCILNMCCALHCCQASLFFSTIFPQPYNIRIPTLKCGCPRCGLSDNNVKHQTCSKYSIHLRSCAFLWLWRGCQESWCLTRQLLLTGLTKENNSEYSVTQYSVSVTTILNSTSFLLYYWVDSVLCHTSILFWDRTINLTWDSTYLVWHSCSRTVRNRTGLLQCYQRLRWAQRQGKRRWSLAKK